MLVDLFARIDSFIMRLESYKDVPPTSAMMDMIVKIMVEVISILSIATAEIKRGRRSEPIASDFSLLSDICLGKYLNRLLGKSDIDGALKRLDTLTQEEARMAIAELLKVTHLMDDKIRLIIDGAQKCISSPTRYPELFCGLAIAQQTMSQTGEENLEKCSSYPNFVLLVLTVQLSL